MKYENQVICNDLISFPEDDDGASFEQFVMLLKASISKYAYKRVTDFCCDLGICLYVDETTYIIIEIDFETMIYSKSLTIKPKGKRHAR